MDDSRDYYTPSRVPVARIVTLLGPYLAFVAGGIAAWLSRHFPGLISDPPETVAAITQGLAFAVGALITWALQHKYLHGLQRWEAGLLALEGGRRAHARREASSTDEREERHERRADEPQDRGDSDDDANAWRPRQPGDDRTDPFDDFDPALLGTGVRER